MGRGLGAFRLAVRMQRLEVLLLVGGGVALTVACLVIAWQNRDLQTALASCNVDLEPTSRAYAECLALAERAGLLRALTFAAGVGGLIVPIATGLFLGIPIVAREVEGRTAPLAWSLARSRRGWLLWRALPIVALVLLVTVLVGIGEELLTRSAPWLEGVDSSFDFYGARGLLVPARGLAAVALGMAIGTVIPRQLPALLMAGGITLAFTIALSIATDRWMQEAAIPLSSEEAGEISRVYDSGFRNDTTGQVMRFDEFAQEHPEVFEGEGPYGDDPPGWTSVMWVLPGSAYDTFVARESAIMLGAAVIGMGLTFLTVGSRRP